MMSKLKTHITGRELFEKVSYMTNIIPSVLRIVINGKEIYPNPERVERRTELVVVHLKTRLLGGVKLK